MKNGRTLRVFLSTGKEWRINNVNAVRGWDKAAVVTGMDDAGTETVIALLPYDTFVGMFDAECSYSEDLKKEEK